LVREGLEAAGVSIAAAETLDSNPAALQDALARQLAAKLDLIVTVGGTGITPGDRAVEVVRNYVEREMPGIMEAARGYGQRRTPYAMISRGVAGLHGQTLIVTFPGSTRGARETLDALLPGLVHTLEVTRRTPPAS
jgi:molybdenum cofactor synthesis domain-containing protein